MTAGKQRSILQVYLEIPMALFSKGDRVRIKNSRMLGQVVAVDLNNPLGPFVYPFKAEASYSVALDDGNGGMRFDFGESMLERESPLESLSEQGV